MAQGEEKSRIALAGAVRIHPVRLGFSPLGGGGGSARGEAK